MKTWTHCGRELDDDLDNYCPVCAENRPAPAPTSEEAARIDLYRKLRCLFSDCRYVNGSPLDVGKYLDDVTTIAMNAADELLAAPLRAKLGRKTP
jgi:hypothetical protein